MQTSVYFRSLCRLLVLAMLAGPFSPAFAGMIGTQQAISPASTASHRATVVAALERSDVASQLQSQGIDPALAKARVATMTDAEVASVAGQINALPAGASNTGWLVAVGVAVAIWYFYMR